MPRTKRAAPKSTSKSKTSTSTLFPLDANRRKEVENYIKDFDMNYNLKLKEIKRETNKIFLQLEQMKKECKAFIQPRIGNTTLEDLDKVLAEITHHSTLYESKFYNLSETTNKTRTIKQKKVKRSLSLADDEGYLTAENSENSTSTRQSRYKTRASNSERPSRSVSRSRLPLTSSSINNYITPANKKIKNDFGFITPKVKPNTPQVVLRRPKEGEMAISMQGSPLLVNPIVCREANVNIPLDDGRTISIQPQYGLRHSQIPMIDSPIRRQIEILRDNLIKVCDMSNI